jgi:dTDP-4-dehydrorhamnose 3,5-epimerase
MKIITTDLPEVKIIAPKVFSDPRGYFFESHHQSHYQELLGIEKFVQDNLSRSTARVLRGLHYQLKFPQGKLVTVISGSVFDVAVDIRPDSKNFGKWVGVILNDQNHHQLYIPSGFAHGFCVLSETVDFHYKCTDYYHPEDEQGIIWNDPQIAIDWPIKIEPLLSTKDLRYPMLKNIDSKLLPKFFPEKAR